MRLTDWLDHIRNVTLARLTTTDVRTTLRNYLAAAFGAGLLIGAAVSFAWLGSGLIACLLLGAGAGYAARSYVSYRRRSMARERRRLISMQGDMDM